MPGRLYRTLALPAALRFDATPEGLSRVRAFLLAAVVIVVPGAWLVALLWLALRRARAQSL